MSNTLRIIVKDNNGDPKGVYFNITAETQIKKVITAFRKNNPGVRIKRVSSKFGLVDPKQTFGEAGLKEDDIIVIMTN